MIVFEYLRWKNLLSTGNQFTEVSLSGSKSTLLVGKNGSGKSTVIDALCFALYNSAFRNINKPLLVNSKNGKQLLVEVSFRVGKNHYLVRRGIKPNVFEIFVNDTLLPQEAASRDYQDILVEDILKMNLKTFKQVVVLGSRSYVPFMQLKPADRREVIEDLLDLKVFTAMNLVCKQKVADTETAIKDAEMEIRYAEENISLEEKRKHILKESNEERLANLKQKIEDGSAKLKLAEVDKANLKGELRLLRESIADEESVRVSIREHEARYDRLDTHLNAVRGKTSFYETHENCPTCQQLITDEFKATAISEGQTAETVALERLAIMEDLLTEAQNRFKEIQKTKKQIADIEMRLAVAQSTIDGIRASLSENTNEINDLESRNLRIDGEVSTDLEKWIAVEEEAQKERESLLNHAEILKAAQVLLKDNGIKAQYIKKYIPQINKLINKYLAAMDFYVKFEMDETFSESFKSRYRDLFQYDSFSEGQKLRIDLAIMFAWRAVAKMRNSAATNILIMDEIFDGPSDEEGQESIFRLLNKLTGETNLILISPKGDKFIDRFETAYQFQMVRDYSKMVKLK